jgi:DNA-binding CsgD family transcriptional regulator
MIIGSGIWWSSAMMGMMYGNYLLGFNTNLIFEYLQYITWAIIAVAFTLGAVIFRKPENRKLLAFTVVTITLVILSIELATLISHINIDLISFQYVVRFFFILSYTILLFLWAVRYALLEARDAAYTVFYSFCISLIITTLVGLFPSDSLPAVRMVLNLISALLFVLDGNKSVSERRDRAPQNRETRRELALFLSGRTLMGLFMGLTSSLLIHSEQMYKESTLNNLILIVTAVVMVCFVVFLVKKQSNPLALLPIAPTAAIGILCLSFATYHLTSLAYIAPAGMCLAWTVLSSARISELKEVLGVREVRLACIDKSIVIISITVGILAYPVLVWLFPSVETGFYLSVLLMLAVITSVSGVLVLFTIRHSAPTVTSNPEVFDEGGLYFQGCKVLAKKFMLTQREHEILSLIGQGHSRPFVCKNLQISDGTARTHITHIYSKLDIHRKEELLEIVKNQMDELSEQQAVPSLYGAPSKRPTF